MEGQIVEDPALRQRYRFSHSVDPDGGAVLHVETWVDPGGGVTPHVHPAMEERFHVLAGTPSLLAGREWARTRRATRSSSPPASATPTATTPARRGAPARRRPPAVLPAGVPRGGRGALPGGADLASRAAERPGALVRAAALAQRHRDMVTLLFPPMPPPLVQRLLFPPLAKLARD